MRKKTAKRPAPAILEERRREPREPAEGEVFLVLQTGAAIPGQLMDRSAHGRRIAHNSALVRTGMELTLREGADEMRVRVLWTRIEGQTAQSGFLIV